MAQSIPCRGDSSSAIEAIQKAWFRWAGPCRELRVDSASEFCSEQFARWSQQHSICVKIIAAGAHWQLGRAERHGGVLQNMLDKYAAEHEIDSIESCQTALDWCCQAKNNLARSNGYTPEILVLGKSRHMPASISATDPSADPAHFLAGEDSPEGIRFRQNLARRETARRAFISVDNLHSLRRSLLRRSRPHRGHHEPGSLVMFWRDGRGEYAGAWHGPARVVIQEGSSIVWVSHTSRLYRCAPEHVRQLSQTEMQNVTEDMLQDNPITDFGRGVFQFRDLAPSPNTGPDHTGEASARA